MGFWEKESVLRCTSCGDPIKETTTRGGTKRLHYYATRTGIQCPSCWTTNRVHPDIVKGVATIG